MSESDKNASMAFMIANEPDVGESGLEDVGGSVSVDPLASPMVLAPRFLMFCGFVLHMGPKWSLSGHL